MIKFIFLTILIFFINHSLTAKSWSEILQEKNSVLKDISEYSIIRAQHTAFSNNRAPIIADPVIKNIAIIDNGEELIDIRTKHNSRITMLPDSPENKAFLEPIYNSGLPSASKIRAAIWHKLEKMVTCLDELVEHFNYKPGTLSQIF